MFYYSFNIGDYQSHTAHLSEMEDLAYRRMLDWCYLHEKPLPLDVEEISRQIRMRTHCDCIAIVLREYFKRTDDGYISDRVQHELSRAAEKSSKARLSAEVRWSTKKTNNANALPTQSERNAIPIHQDTNTPIHKDKATVVAPPDGVSQSVWNDFVKQRKAKKAPVSDTVITKIRNQAEKAGWSLEDALAEICARGWTGFNADWVKEKQTFAQQAADVARTTVPAPANQDAALKQIMADREKCSPPPAHIRELMKGILGVKNA
jgi:uncharacterized protein YdaU (DUF1376 family)|uniref:YdaU family protein n=1 Tax=Shewanella sp. TaxID=50422 RepID=UPI004047E1E2